MAVTLAPSQLLQQRLQTLAKTSTTSEATTPTSVESTKAELTSLRNDAVKLGTVAAFDAQAKSLFPNLFDKGGAPWAQAPGSSTFAATQGGRGVGGTVGLLRPTLPSLGVASFTPMNVLTDLAKSGAPAPKGLLILDTNLGDVEKTADKSWAAATLDHHGPVHGTGKGRGVNSTTQLLDKFEAALGADVGAARASPKFTAAHVVVEKAAKEHGISATTTQKEQAAAGLLALNLTSLSSDNVGDGLSWPAWMSKNQGRVLLDGDLRATIREATVHEDFGVFGGNYLNGVDDVSQLSQPLKLQSALFLAYDEALAKAGVTGSDRAPPDKAEAIANDVGSAINALLKNPALVEKRAHDFFFQVGMALTTVEEHALVASASVKNKSGGYDLPVFDVSKLPPELGTFAKWAVPPLFGKHTLQMTTTAPNADGRSTTIIAIPDGRTLSSGKGLLSIAQQLNDLEKARTPAGQQPAAWFGRDVVLLPSQPGSLLTPADLKKVVEDAGLLKAT